MKQLRVFKYSATGNDFLLIDQIDPAHKQSLVAPAERKSLARALCQRRLGLGADGLVFLEPEKDLDFGWDFYNSDGSRAEMCGNAARCVSLHQFRRKKIKALRFKTLAGIIETDYSSANKITVKMLPIKEVKWNQLAAIGSEKIHYDFVVAGVPHAIVSVPHFKGKEGLKKLARQIKGLPIFGAASTNVTFIRDLGDYSAQAMSFERGVENFTLSCGTGAVAAAYSLLQGEEENDFKIEVPGGKLSVIIRKQHPYLTGPAQFVADMEIHHEF